MESTTGKWTDEDGSHLTPRTLREREWRKSPPRDVSYSPPHGRRGAQERNEIRGGAFDQREVTSPKRKYEDRRWEDELHQPSPRRSDSPPTLRNGVRREESITRRRGEVRDMASAPRSSYGLKGYDSSRDAQSESPHHRLHKVERQRRTRVQDKQPANHRVELRERSPPQQLRHTSSVAAVDYGKERQNVHATPGSGDDMGSSSEDKDENTDPSFLGGSGLTVLSETHSDGSATDEHGIPEFKQYEAKVTFSPSTELPLAYDDPKLKTQGHATSKVGVPSKVNKVAAGRPRIPSGRNNDNDEVERSLRILRQESEARQQILREIRQAQDMRDNAGNDDDKAFWDRQIDTLNESLLKLRAGVRGELGSTRTKATSTAENPIYEVDLPRETTTLQEPKQRSETIKVRAPADLPEGKTFTARAGGRTVTATVPPGGVFKGDIFTVQLSSSERKTPSPISMEQSHLKQQVKKIKVRAPSRLAEGHKFTVKMEQGTIVATVPKGGVKKGDIFTVPIT